MKPKKKTRYLITGGAGFIGSHLSEALIEKGYNVTIIDDLSTGQFENIAHLADHPEFNYVIENITNNVVVDKLVSECDIIFHLASTVGVKLVVTDPLRLIETNIIGTYSLLKSANRHKKKILIASTSEIYGKSDCVPFSEDSDRILGPTTSVRWSYSTSKAVDELIGLAYFKQLNLPVVIFRLFNVIGPRQAGQYGMVVPRFVQQALRKGSLVIYGNGDQSRCFCDVKDIVRALISLSTCPEAVGEVFNIGSTEEVKILDLAYRVIEMINTDNGIKPSLDNAKEGQMVFLPFEEVYGEGIEDMQRRVPNTNKINKLIGWRPHISLEKSLKRVIDYHKSLEKKSSDYTTDDLTVEHDYATDLTVEHDYATDLTVEHMYAEQTIDIENVRE